jgi:transcriptional regulator with XRE-family HTH domain
VSAAEPFLNAQLIRDRRIELRLSVRDMAKVLGTSITTIATIESPREYGEIPLRMLCKLADVLALNITDLLLHDPAPAPADRELARYVVDPLWPDPTARPPDPDLVAKVASILFELRHLTAPAVIAAALDITTSDVEAAVTAMGPFLSALGLRAHRLRGDVAIVRMTDVPGRDELRAAWQQDYAQRSMTLMQARMLHAVWRGGFQPSNMSNPERVVLAQLVNAGLVELPVATGANTATLAAEVRECLEVAN